jgi:hypothetical protein
VLSICPRTDSFQLLYSKKRKRKKKRKKKKKERNWTLRAFTGHSFLVYHCHPDIGGCDSHRLLRMGLFVAYLIYNINGNQVTKFIDH